MDARVCHEHLAELLSEELGLLDELQQLLLEEREVIDSRDLKALERTTHTRQERVAALAALEEQRRALASLHGQAGDRMGLEQLMKWCDPQGRLTPLVRECRQRALRCRDLSDRNGLLVSARLQRVGEALQALTGRGERADTYSPRGYMRRTRGGRDLGAV